MSRIVHFEIPAENPESAAEFYHNAFGWKIEKWDGPVEYWMVTTGQEPEMGINGGIYKKGPMEGTINTIGVENLNDSLATVKANGGNMVGEILEIPGVGAMAYCTDREGVVFGMMQPIAGMM